MVLSSTQPIGRLPLELLREISSNLDNKSLKSFRIACVDPSVTAATASILFKTISVGLGTLDWSLGRRKAQPLDIPDLKHWSCVRQLVVDTRYPFKVSKELCFKRYQQFNYRDRPGGHTKYMSEDYAIPIPQWEETCFLELVEGIIEILGAVRRVHWRTSEYVPPELHQDLFTVLSQYCRSRNCDFDVSLNMDHNKYSLPPFLASLSNMRRFEIIAESIDPWFCHQVLGLSDLEAIASAIKQSERLQSFTLSGFGHVQAFFYPHPCAADLIATALSKLSGLKEIKGNANWDLFSNLNWIKMSSLKQLQLNGPKGSFHWRGSHKTAELLDQLATPYHPVRLEKFATTAYDMATYNFLKSPNTHLTDLMLNLEYCHSPEAGDLFWKEVLPRFATTLRRLKVLKYDDTNLAWAWLHEPNNGPKLALRQCKKLEVLSIPFCKPKISYITDMVSDVASHCPSLRLVCMNFDPRNMASNIDQTMTKLTLWNTFSEELKGRQLTVRYKRRQVPKQYLYKWCQFREHVEEGFEPPLWFDCVIQSWELSQIYPGVSGFKRQYDQYITNKYLQG
ncbi:hypothetical protein AA313_de0205552 [Arthrobotrys entomopaga]|nr:hypothetical protein AA313_de0205552 [Arthrobotrys entomopaga]